MNKESDLGIDYGRGITNIDNSTGIRYGVIPIGEVTQAWYDSAESDYGSSYCGNCGTDLPSDFDPFGDDNRCPSCGEEIRDGSMYPDSPLSWNLDDGEYRATQGGDDSVIFILKSPFYTLCAFCSPCAPGAGYILDSREQGVKAYCFGHDFFDEGKAPYPVFSVETGKKVYP